MVHHNHHHDDDAGGQSGGPDQGDAPDVDTAPAHTRVRDGGVEAGWLRPRAYRALGRPRISTIVLLVLWIAVLVLYLEMHHPG
jgi:hypothetical protein